MNRREFMEVSGASLVVAAAGKTQRKAILRMPPPRQPGPPLAAETAPHRPGRSDGA